MTQQGRTGVVDPILEDALNVITGESSLDGAQSIEATSNDSVLLDSKNKATDAEEKNGAEPFIDQVFDDFNEEPLLIKDTQDFSSFEPEMTFDTSVLGEDDSFLSEVMGDGSFPDISTSSSDNELFEPVMHDQLNDFTPLAETVLQVEKTKESHSEANDLQKTEDHIDADAFLESDSDLSFILTSDDSSTLSLEPNVHEDDFEPDSQLATNTEQTHLDGPGQTLDASIDALLDSGDTGLLSGMDSTGFDLDSDDDEDIDTLLGIGAVDSTHPGTGEFPTEKNPIQNETHSNAFIEQLESDFLSDASAYPSSPDFATSSQDNMTEIDPYLFQSENIDNQVGIKDPEDLEDFLESLHIPKNQPIKSFGPADPMQEPEPLSHYLAQEAQKTTSTDASSSDTSPLQDKSAKSEPLVKKKRKWLSTLFSALLIAGLGAGGYAFYQYSMSHVEANVKELDESSLQLKSTLAALTEKAKQLEERLAKTDGKMAQIEGYYASLQTEQSRVIQEQSRLNDQLALIKQESGEYEAAMIERLQSVLLLTRGISDQMNSQELRLKESVFRETVAALESRANGLGNDQLNAVLKDLQENTTRLEQIEVNLQAQKTLLTLMGDETEFVKTRLGQMENRETRKNPPTPARPSAAPSASVAPGNATKSSTPQKAPEQIAKELGWQIDIPNPHEESKSGYTLIGVLQKSPGVYEIYVQKKMARSATEYESYIYSPSEKSIIPGYGMIKGVQQTDSDNSAVPYQILTETGIIRGRMR